MKHISRNKILGGIAGFVGFLILYFLTLADPTKNTIDGDQLSLISGLIGCIVAFPIAYRITVLRVPKQKQRSKYWTSFSFYLAFSILLSFFVSSTIGGYLNLYRMQGESYKQTAIVLGKSIKEARTGRFSRTTKHIIIVESRSKEIMLEVPKQVWYLIIPNSKIELSINNGFLGYKYVAGIFNSSGYHEI